ncbi:MAG: hypothetical protein ACFCBU_06265, partial [Cyanophyceae cyanobacterium]
MQTNRKLAGLVGALAAATLGSIAPQPVQGHEEAQNPTCAFEIEISAGSLEGNRFSGSFSFDHDQLTGEGEEIVTVENGLEISMAYLGRTYRQEDDRNYPDYPRVILQDGKVELVDFWVDPRDRGIWWT